MVQAQDCPFWSKKINNVTIMHTTPIHLQVVNHFLECSHNIAYRNEGAMTFEKFVATFQKAIDDLEMYACGMDNSDIVDLLWTKMGNPKLAPYVVSIKVQSKSTMSPLCMPRPYISK